MAKQLNIELGVGADVSAAKKSFQELSEMLTKIQAQPSNLFDDQDLKKASQAAQDLQKHLNAAVNMDTGKLDLNKFSQSLSKSNQSLQQLYGDLNRIGPQGQQAFLEIARSINQADASAINLGSKIKSLGTSLANTARWQISSSLLHGFVSAVQGAVGYAEDLNESLNNIRIVTGQNIDQMAKFAEQANKSAKALSTTTTEYTNASLIYYQQGLNDSEVKERTDITIKMANVARESAETVSDQMTAVWNNFDDGTKSLEYYADVMTALGAATASSTDEIAGGLEKFAAVGETIGLSFEYATSALATITSNTRQSEEVVGTALKTIFARIQGLKLGETLEDGVDLNKYSKALATVGISIFEQNGELKKMDNILNEMGAKWGTLSKAQQTALAQTVAGVRQYTQLTALMENWDNGDSDSMMANLNTANTSTGALQEQADIYAESWEGARDRVTAAAEGIYDSLIDDEFFIDVLDGFSKFLGGINAIIDGMGGLKGIFLMVGGYITQVFAKEIPKVLSNIGSNFDVITGKANENGKKLLEQNSQSLDAIDVSGTTDEVNAEIQAITQVSHMKSQLKNVSDKLSDSEKAYYQSKIEHMEIYGKEAAEIGKLNDKLKQEIELKENAAAREASKKASSKVVAEIDEEIKKTEELIEAKKKSAKELESKTEDFTAKKIGLVTQESFLPPDEYESQLSALNEEELQNQEQIKQTTAEIAEEERKLAELRQKRAKAPRNIEKEIKKELKELEKVSLKYQKLVSDMSKIKKQASVWSEQAKNIKDNASETEKLKKSMIEYLKYLKSIGLAGEGMDEFIDKVEKGKISLEEAADALENWETSGTLINTSELDKFELEIDEIETKLRELGVSDEALNDLATKFESGAISAEEYRQALERLNAEASESPKHTMAVSESIGLIAGKAMSLMGAISALQNLGNIWNNEDLSTGEKLMQTMGALIPVVSSLTAVTNAKALADLSAASATILQAMGLGFLIPARVGDTAATLGEAGANVTLQTTMLPILALTLILVAAIGSLVIIIGVLVAAINAISDAYNADAIAAEKAQVAAQELAKAYQEAKQSYEDMIAAMDEYQSARDALDSLTKGTEEYSQALKKANEAALELIDSYGQYMSAGDWRWEDGQLIIDEAALESAKRKKESEVNIAYGASSMGAAKAREASAVANQTDLKRGYLDENILEAYGGAVAQSAGLMAIPIVGQIAAPIAGVLEGLSYGVKQTQEFAFGAGVDAVMKRYREGDKNIFDSQQNLAKSLIQFGPAGLAMTKALWENRDALIELGEKYDLAEQQAKDAAQQNAQNYINENYATSDYADEMVHLVGNQYYERSEELYDQIYEGLDSNKGLEKGAQAYFEEMGISSQQGFKLEEAKDGTVKYSVIDENGERQEKEVSAEFIASTLAAAQVQDELASSCNLLINAFKKLDSKIVSTESALDEGMREFLSTGDTSSLTKEQFDAMAQMSASQMEKYLDTLGIDEKNVDQLGYDSIDDLIESMNLENTKESWDTALEGTNIEDIQGSENLSLTGAQNIQQNLQEIKDFYGDGVDAEGNPTDAEGTKGSEMQAEFEKLTAGISEGLDKASQSEFWNQLGQIGDFENAEEWDQFLENMKESGELTKEEAEALEKYVNEAKDAVNATESINFEEMAEGIKGLVDVMDTLKDGTRDISQEQFEALEAQGIDTSKFAKTIDGWRYIGETGEFMTEVSNNIKSQFTEARRNFDDITAKVKQASDNLAAAQEATENAKNLAIEENKGRLMIAAIVQNIKDSIMTKIEKAWNEICNSVMEVYDVVVQLVNTIGEGLSNMWNDFAVWLETFLNSIITTFAEFLEGLGFNTKGWKEVNIDEVQFDKKKTAAELAEEVASKDLEEAVALMEENLDGLCQSIEASADYLSRSELLSEKDKITEQKQDYEKQLEEKKNSGAPPAEIDYIERMIAALEKQEESYDKALKSKTYGEMMGADVNVEEMEAYIDLLMKENEEMESAYETAEDFRDAMTQVAVANKKMEKGVKKLADGWEGFDDIMSDSTSTAEDVSSVLPEINEGLQDVLNLSDEQFELLPPDFAQKNWGLIQDVVNGVEGSVDELRNKAGEEMLLNIGAKVDTDGDGSIDAAFMEIHNAIAAYDNMDDFTVGVAIDPEKHAEFIANCESMINAAGMTAEQAQAYFASMGYDVELEEVKPESQDVSKYSYYELDEAATEKAGGVPQFKKTPTEIPVTTEASATAYAIKTITPNGSYGGGVGVNTTAPKSSRKSDSGGGGNNKSTSDSKKKKSDMVERYKEVSDSLDEVADRMEDASRQADRLWGRDRIKKMREVNEEIQNEIDLLKEKGNQINNYLKSDRTDLDAAAGAMGITFVYDEATGAITNYEEKMTQLFNEREALLRSFGDTMDESETKQLEEFDKKFEELTSAIDQYDETRELKRENDNAIEEKFNTWQDNNADILSYELELKITINDNELKRLEHYLSKTEDDFFKMAEAAAIMVGSAFDKGSLGQLDIYKQNLTDINDQYEKLVKARAKNDISPEAFQTGLQELYDSIYDNLGNLQELDSTMMHYYEDTLSAAGEEIAKYTDRMEHQTSVLEHYQSLMEIMGKSTDYKAMGVILEGQSKTMKNSMDAAKATLDLYNSEAEEKKAKYEYALEHGTAAEAELYKAEYEAALAAADEAQEDYLSKAEAYAESLKAILENSLNQYAQTLENALTGGTSFDQLTTKMERAASLQEEYLTTTNKIYETNKLMNQAQQEIDKSTNSVAQRRLKQFIEETNQLQKKNKLSQYELEIQQAKYDLLLAEIALEEAQDAKSMVRLQRDSEGNFGYVYTADQSQIDQAAQDLADKQNALYNIALEGANGYVEKYQQTLNEMYSTLTDLQQQYLDGAFESEAEYHAAMDEAKAYYYEKLEQYSSLHAIAISTDARVVEDAWSTEFSSMVYETENWKNNVEDYINDVSAAFTEWSTTVEELKNGILGESLNDIEQNVKDVVTESDALLETLTKEGGLLDSIDAEFDAVSAVTEAYGKQRETIQGLITDYEGLADAIQEKKRAEMEEEEGDDETPQNPDPPAPTEQTDEELAAGIAKNATEIITKVHTGEIPVGSNGWPPNAKAAGYSDDAIEIAKKAINDSKSGGGYAYCYEKALELVKSYDTGGYTGAWGSYGKLAMLHEKELVLNKEDTENLFKSMELLDSIVKAIDLQAANSALGGILSSPSLGGLNSNEVLEQQVTIEANFPNVSSRGEIEEAFTTLINRASQYANRK